MSVSASCQSIHRQAPTARRTLLPIGCPRLLGQTPGMLRLGGLLVVLASLLAAGCSIDRIEWESTGFVVEGVTRELEEEHHLEHPTVECIKREVGGAWWECRAHEGEAEYKCKVEGRAARGDPRDRVRARGTGGARADRDGAGGAGGRARRGVTSRVSAPVAPGYGPRAWRLATRTTAVTRPLPIRSSPRRRASRRRAAGPPTGRPPSRRDYHHPAAGWGAARSVGRVIWRSREPVEAPRSVLKMNHPDKGFDCPGCAWRRRPARPAPRHLRERHQARHLGDDAQEGRRRVLRRAHRHRARGLERLRARGRRAGSPSRSSTTRRPTRYVPISWEEAFALVGSTLRGLASPNEASFYTSGRLGNEATFLYQLWVRELGTNNLPDCSNMCHEASGRALTASLGTRQGHVRPRRLGARRPDLRDRRERRLERAAHAHDARRGVRARRGGRAREPDRRGGVRPHDRPARLRQDGDPPRPRRPAR